MSSDYKVGYGKPPKKAQFKKGKSGNPKGRPKKSINTINFMEKEFQSEIQVKEGDKTFIITKQQAIIKQIINNAVRGDFKASVLVLEHMKQIDAYREEAIKAFDSIKKEDVSILENYKERIKKENVIEIIGGDKDEY